jgi:hypothetical protein
METYVAEKPCDEDISCMSMSNVSFLTMYRWRMVASCLSHSASDIFDVAILFFAFF